MLGVALPAAGGVIAVAHVGAARRGGWGHASHLVGSSPNPHIQHGENERERERRKTISDEVKEVYSSGNNILSTIIQLQHKYNNL